MAFLLAISLWPAAEAPAAPKPGRLHFGWAPLRGLRDNRYKYVEAPRSELYDLESDPEESTNLIHEKPEIVHRLRAAMEDIEGRGTSRFREPKAIDAETAQRLQADVAE